jgi:hypothetical protein
MCNDWMTASLCVFLWDGSDQLEERRIALEAILFRTGSSSWVWPSKPSKSLVTACTALPKDMDTLVPNIY